MLFNGNWVAMPPSVKRGARGLAKAFVWSMIFLLVAYYLAYQHFSRLDVQAIGSAAATAEKAMDPASQAPWMFSGDRIFAFLDAVLAGLLAFAMLGVFTFLSSLRRPEEEKLDDRVSYIYSARREQSPASVKYVKEQVMLLGATAQEARMNFTFMQFSACGQFLKAATHVEMDIVNMMKLDRYHQDMPLAISLDKLEGFDRDLGSITRVQTTPCTEDGAYCPPTRHLTAPFRFTNDANSYKTTVKLDIPPGGGTRYEYTWDGWGKVEDVNFAGANRFAERLVLTFSNQSDRDVKLCSYIPEHRKCRTIQADKVLRPGETWVVTFDALPPTEDVAFATKQP